MATVFDAKELMTPLEVAEMLGLKVETLARWRCDKSVRLPYVKAGRLVRYKRSEVEKFIERYTMDGE